MRTLLIVALVAVAGVAYFQYDPTLMGLREPAPSTQIGEAAEEAVEKVEDVADEAGDAAEQAADDIEEAGDAAAD